MSANIIISFDGTDNDRDALALGRILGNAGAELSLAYVRHSHESDPNREREAQADAEQVLDSGAQWLGQPEITRHIVVNASTGEGLRSLSESENANVLVFGSDWHTAPGHVQPGASAVRLMDGGPVAVAIAAAGLRNQKDANLTHIALPGGEVDPAARETAEALTARCSFAMTLASTCWSSVRAPVHPRVASASAPHRSISLIRRTPPCSSSRVASRSMSTSRARGCRQQRRRQTA